MFKFRARMLPAALAAWSISASAQQASLEPIVPTSAGASAAIQPCCSVIPALTPVSIEILAPLGSKTSKSGDTFPIRLAAPIVVAGKEIVAAGATGMGEVIHAKKSGGMGAAGELVLAARYIDLGGLRLPLRSFNLSANGKSSIAQVDALAVASAASPIPVSVIGFFINGGQITVPEGTVAWAKTREAFSLGTLSTSKEAPPPTTSAAITSTGRTSE